MSNQKESTTQRDSVETKARIIEATARVLAEKGYEATTLREIARAADAAPGLVHYYFGGKEQLVVEVLKAMGDRYTETTTQLAQTVGTEQRAQAALMQPLTRVSQEPEWYRLRYEMFALALHNPALATGVQELLTNGRRDIGSGVQRVLEEEEVPTEALSALLLACFDGLALQKLLDPDVDIETAYKLLIRMVQSLQSSHR